MPVTLSCISADSPTAVRDRDQLEIGIKHWGCMTPLWSCYSSDASSWRKSSTPFLADLAKPGQAMSSLYLQIQTPGSSCITNSKHKSQRTVPFTGIQRTQGPDDKSSTWGVLTPRTLHKVGAIYCHVSETINIIMTNTSGSSAETALLEGIKLCGLLHSLCYARNSLLWPEPIQEIHPQWASHAFSLG